MPTNREQIISIAIEIIESRPDGIRCSELCQKLGKKLPDIKASYLLNIIVKLDQLEPDSIYKPDRGLFRHVKYRESGEHEKDNNILEESYQSRQISNSNRLLKNSFS
jgi:hypothetical protein